MGKLHLSFVGVDGLLRTLTAANAFAVAAKPVLVRVTAFNPLNGTDRYDDTKWMYGGRYTLQFVSDGGDLGFIKVSEDIIETEKTEYFKCLKFDTSNGSFKSLPKGDTWIDNNYVYIVKKSCPVEADARRFLKEAMIAKRGQSKASQIFRYYDTATEEHPEDLSKAHIIEKSHYYVYLYNEFWPRKAGGATLDRMFFFVRRDATAYTGTDPVRKEVKAGEKDPKVISAGGGGGYGGKDFDYDINLL